MYQPLIGKSYVQVRTCYLIEKSSDSIVLLMIQWQGEVNRAMTSAHLFPNR